MNMMSYMKEDKGGFRGLENIRDSYQQATLRQKVQTLRWSIPGSPINSDRRIKGGWLSGHVILGGIHPKSETQTFTFLWSWGQALWSHTTWARSKEQMQEQSWGNQLETLQTLPFKTLGSVIFFFFLFFIKKKRKTGVLAADISVLPSQE